jgi:hypothetical protein
LKDINVVGDEMTRNSRKMTNSKFFEKLLGIYGEYLIPLELIHGRGR